MSVTEINEVHHEYIDLFERVKAAWTYHQFSRGVGHVFVEEAMTDAVEVDFKPLFEELKQASEELNSATVTKVRSRLIKVSSDLSRIVSILEEEDSKLSPSVLRLFFQRVKSYDEQVLIRMIRFFLAVQAGRKWAPARIDKVDYLATCLAETMCGTVISNHRTKLLPLLEKFWGMASVEPLPPGALDACRARSEAIDAEIATLTSLSQLRKVSLISRYREFKHGLGRGFFNPELLEHVLQTNLNLRAMVRQFYSHEERRLFADYEELAELERSVTLNAELGEELSQVHSDVERLERRVQENNVRLDDLEEVRRRVSALLPEVQKYGNTGRSAEGVDDTLPVRLAEAMSEMPPWLGPERNREFLALLRALDGIQEGTPPEEALHLPEIAPYELEAREVVAYRRLQESDEDDRAAVDVLALSAAAVRRSIERDADEIRDLPTDEPVEEGSEGIVRVRQALKIASEAMTELGVAADQAAEAGDPQEAAELGRLRVRLMRSYSNIWLLTYPLSAERDSA